ncbi:MAG: CapA family protein [Acidobacteria bacterium]|nr:CapA family protein [Acidobacteriota bacterium]
MASDWAPIRAFDSLVREDPEAAYGDLLPVLRQADLRIVNCECALTTAAKPVWKSGAVFKGAPGHVKGLTAVPFDVACLGNNHVLDYGVRGLRETLRVLARSGVATVGAGLTEDQAHAPLSLERNGLAIHLVNISEGEDLTASRGGPGVFGWDIPRAVAAIRNRRKARGVVIAIAHCGLEYVPYPPPYVVTAFRAMIDAGADAVIGHHPHVPQGIEWHNGRPIVYSLGNFLFYQHTELFHRKIGFCVSLQFDGKRIAGLELVPYRITDSGLRRLDRQEHAAFSKTMTILSKPFRTASGPDRAWHAYLANYGTAGFTAEVSGILARMKTEPQKAAAMFRNRITTMQHVELWRDFLTATMAGGPTGYPREASRMVEEYFTRPYSPYRSSAESTTALTRSR